MIDGAAPFTSVREHPTGAPAESYDSTLYDPADPLNAADRLNDPDDGVDYDRLIAESEADRVAGNYLSFEEFDQGIQAKIADLRRWRHARGWDTT